MWKKLFVPCFALTAFFVFSLFFVNFVSASTTANFSVSGGTDASASAHVSFSTSNITKLSLSDDSRIQSNGSWPVTGAYDESKYIEFLFLPNIPDNAIIENVSLSNEFRRSGALTGAKLEVWDGSTFTDETLTTGTINVDHTDTVDVSSFINTPSKVNNLKARFLAYRGGTASTTTSHDFIGLSVTYSMPPAVTLSSISITHPANKLSYLVGDSLDISGLEITGNYSDGSTKIENITNENITGFDGAVPITGEVLTITVGAQATSFSIDITAPVLPPPPDPTPTPDPVLDPTPVSPPAPVVDTIAPTGTILINGGALFTNDINVNLSLSATDDISGVAQMHFSNGSSYSALEPYVTTKSWTLSKSGDGLKTVRVKFMDNAGNENSPGIPATITLDTVAPVITLLGSNPVILNVGDSYTDAGATALDNSISDLTPLIIVKNLVDANTVGSYVVTYDVVDQAGNPATQITRTVNVNEKPVEENKEEIPPLPEPIVPVEEIKKEDPVIVPIIPVIVHFSGGGHAVTPVASVVQIQNIKTEIPTTNFIKKEVSPVVYTAPKVPDQEKIKIIKSAVAAGSALSASAINAPASIKVIKATRNFSKGFFFVFTKAYSLFK